MRRRVDEKETQGGEETGATFPGIEASCQRVTYPTDSALSPMGCLHIRGTILVSAVMWPHIRFICRCCSS